MAEEKIKGRWFDITKPEQVEEIIAKRHAWSMTDKGYFLIKVDHERKLIGVAFCIAQGHTVTKVIEGSHYEDLYYTICRLGVIKQPEHLCYLGSELQKAFLALKYGLVYVQDDELDWNKKITPAGA